MSADLLFQLSALFGLVLYFSNALIFNYLENVLDELRFKQRPHLLSIKHFQGFDELSLVCAIFSVIPLVNIFVIGYFIVANIKNAYIFRKKLLDYYNSFHTCGGCGLDSREWHIRAYSPQENDWECPHCAEEFFYYKTNSRDSKDNSRISPKIGVWKALTFEKKLHKMQRTLHANAEYAKLQLLKSKDTHGITSTIKHTTK